MMACGTWVAVRMKVSLATLKLARLTPMTTLMALIKAVHRNLLTMQSPGISRCVVVVDRVSTPDLLIWSTEHKDHRPLGEIADALHGDLKRCKPVTLWMVLEFKLKTLDLHQVKCVKP